MTARTVEQIVETAKRLKEHRVAEAEDERDFDLFTTVTFIRAGEEIAELLCPPDRDRMLWGAWAGCGMFSADQIVLVNESYSAREAWAREVGRRPQPGELQATFEGGRSDLVTECLMVNWAERATGNAFVTSIEYTLDREAKRLTWGEQPEIVTGKHLVGLIPDALRHAVRHNHDTILELTSLGFPAELFGLTDQEARVHADMGAARLLVRLGYAVKLSVYDEEAAEIINESMEHDAGLDFIKFDSSTGAFTGRTKGKHWEGDDPHA